MQIKGHDSVHGLQAPLLLEQYENTTRALGTERLAVKSFSLCLGAERDRTAAFNFCNQNHPHVRNLQVHFEIRTDFSFIW